MTGRRLLLLRHGRTSWNDAGRAQGHRDIELDDLGHEQAARVAPYLAALRPAVLCTSDLARARQTAAYVEKATGLTARVDPRLREYDVGARQGMTSPEFEASFPEAYAAWSAGDDLPTVPGSESPGEVGDRILPALRELLEELGPGDAGVVVTHGAALKVALVALLGWPLEQTAQLAGIGNCAWCTVAERTGGGLRLQSYNESPPDFASPDAVG